MSDSLLCCSRGLWERLSDVKQCLHVLCWGELTLGPFAFSAGPQVQQGGALVQQWVGILHTDPVDVVHAKLKLSRQLCREDRGRREEISAVTVFSGKTHADVYIMKATDLPSSNPAVQIWCWFWSRSSPWRWLWLKRLKNKQRAGLGNTSSCTQSQCPLN